MKKVRVCVITGFGINADLELAEAFRRTGGLPERVHLSDLIENPAALDRFGIVAFPGGFSFGDHLGSGKVFASLCKQHLRARLDAFVNAGKLVIGICNGFQMLVKMGILPNLEGDWAQDVSLIHNDSGVFEDRWVRLDSFPGTRCVWTIGLPPIELPVRHGEGKFVARDAGVDNALVDGRLIALTYRSANGGPARYPENPNGSLRGIAGICDRTGRVFGLMPHPEAFLTPYNHPRWTRSLPERAAGLLIFERGIEYARKNT
ncbi:MAG: phosphoribosylformylglycinamidine synthase subunit PurQ [Spirochaetales bacterium]|nr:phosphoribosylformylglycinamidine synthase subunit PurQ [Spirochaetales bacterium]